MGRDWLPALLLLGVAACSEAPRAPSPGFWTLFDARALYAGGATSDTALAPDAGLPGGIPLGGMLAEDGVTLPVHRGFAEGYDAGYVVTELWSRYDRVWLQPLYVPVVGWAEGGKPIPLAPQGGAWVFGVGPGSGFYSPFWQMIYVDVPAGTPVEALASERRILDGGYPLHFGPGRTAVLAPGTDLIVPAGVKVGSGWLDGAPAPFVDFGQGLFSWRDAAEDARVIDELPLYVFAFRGAGGALVSPGAIPVVLAPGPPRSGLTMPPNLAGEPRYSAFWRIYRVTLPANARVFAPADYAAIDSVLAAAGVPTVTTYGVTSGVEPYLGKIAIDPIDPATNAPACFAQEGLLEPGSTGSCHWLDAQVAVDSLVDPSAIERTELTVTAPVVDVRGTPVPPL